MPQPALRPVGLRSRFSHSGPARRRPSEKIEISTPTRPVHMTTGYLSFYGGRRVMVTGGLGFIGSNLVRQLVDGRRRRADCRLAPSRLRRQPLQHPRHRGSRARQHLRRAGPDLDGRARPGPRSDLQPRGSGQPHRQHAGSLHRSRDQLPRAAVDARGLPQVQSRRPRRLRGHATGLRPARPTACRRDAIWSGPPISTASTRRPASPTTCSTTTSSASAPARCD